MNDDRKIHGFNEYVKVGKNEAERKKNEIEYANEQVEFFRGALDLTKGSAAISDDDKDALCRIYRMSIIEAFREGRQDKSKIFVADEFHL